jgi:predicted RNA-binding protein with RPS1 domain
MVTYICKLAEAFLKLSEDEEATIDISAILSNIVDKINEYEVNHDIEIGREALRMLDDLKHLIAAKMTEDFTSAYIAAKKESK